jgi:hypothetical protein
VRGTICVLLLCLSAFAVGCGSDNESADGSATAASTGSTTGEAAPAAETPTLVGRWERVNECSQLVEADERAGLAEIAPGNVGDYFPDATPKELAQKDELCKGAKPFVHSHFFNENGGFGSLTEDLEPVDDGVYEITENGTFVIGDVTFHYKIEGDSLMLTPVLTKEMKAEARAHPLEFTDAGWALAVSYPGQVWKRVDCSGWC